MYKKLKLPWFFLCAVVIYFQACKKSDQHLVTTQSQKSNTILEEVKSWYYSQISAAISGMRTELPDRNFGSPYWILAKVDSGDGKSIKVPMTDYTLRNIGYCKYFFRKDESGTIQGMVLEVLYKPSYWRKKVQEARENRGLVRSMKQDFTGVILQYDLSGNFIKGRSYKDGQIITALVPKESSKLLQPNALRRSGDPEDPDDDSNFDEGDNSDGGSGSGWVIDLPGVDITPGPSDPLPGWTPSDPWNPENPYPSGGGPEDYVPGTIESAGSSGSNIRTELITATSTFDDEYEPAGVPAPVNCGAYTSTVNGLIVSVYNYWANPRIPIIDYKSNGRTVTRRMQIMDLRGSAHPLPGAVVTVRWDYIINYTYSYTPYSPPITRQRSSYTMNVYYANQ